MNSNPTVPHIAFDLFEAVCGVQGDFTPLNAADAPVAARRPGLINPFGHLPCTRYAGHAGPHIAAHYDGHLLARWA